MPRVKALTTGSVPSFLDLILNFAESDTTSSLATQDTWLAQIKSRGGNIVFYGDDTWLKLFPDNSTNPKEPPFFLRSDGTSSFFVSVSSSSPAPGPNVVPFLSSMFVEVHRLSIEYLHQNRISQKLISM